MDTLKNGGYKMNKGRKSCLLIICLTILLAGETYLGKKIVWADDVATETQVPEQTLSVSQEPFPTEALETVVPSVITDTMTIPTTEATMSPSPTPEVTMSPSPAKTVKCVGVTLNQSSITITGTETYELVANVRPMNATNKKVIWCSSNTSVATVDSYGVVSGFVDGRATITAMTEDGGYSDWCTVTVTGNTVEYVSLNKAYCNLKIGQQESLTANVYPKTTRYGDVFWSSSNPDVVSVDVNGIITARKPGTATITVKNPYFNKQATCKVTVSKIEVSGITLAQTNAKVIIGTPRKLKANVLPENATDRKVKWYSSNISIAKVDQEGAVKGVAYGTATITAQIGDYRARCKVTVVGSYGTLNYSSGGFYKGQAGNGKRNGKGTFTRVNGTKIQATWSNDKIISKTATVTFKNGDVFKGDYRNYKKNGKGTYTKKDRTQIKGKWKNNKLVGTVTVSYRDGDKYKGSVKDNKKSGSGTYTFANGDVYTGKWKNDKMNGQGKYTFKNGAYYKGTFKNNKLTGTGYYKARKGKLYKGKFKNGKMVKVISVS